MSLAAACAGCVIGLPAHAQTTPANEPVAPEARLETVEVTGTRIPRPDQSATSPVVSATREVIEQHGVLQLEDFLNTLPQMSPDFSRTANNPGDGTARANLRSLGSARTLVLLNGRRLASPGTGTFVDLNGIPEAVISRVDVLTGGTSAVYGSDAVAGVVNFITRRDLDGIEVGWQRDMYDAGDGSVDDKYLVWGLQSGNGRAHLVTYVDKLTRDPVLQGARAFTRHVIGDDKETGQLYNDGSLAGPEGTIDVNGDPADALIFDPAGELRPFDDPGDRYDYASDNYLQTSLSRLSAGAFGSLEFNAGSQAFVELMYTSPRVNSRLAPVPLSTFIDVPIEAPFFSAETRQFLGEHFDPESDGIANFRIRRRLSEAEPRIDSFGREYWRAVMGVDGRLAGWDWRASYSYDHNHTNERVENNASRSRVQQGVMVDAAGNCLDPSDGCVAVNLFGAGQLSSAAVDFIRIAPLSNFTTTIQQVANISATSAPVDLPAGPLNVSLGAEWRRVKSDYAPDPAFFSGDVLGYEAQQPVHDAFEVKEVFGELLAPILANAPLAYELSLEAGARYTEHSAAGSDWTWKLGLQWRPVADLRFRAMAQRAVRAPNIGELYTQPTLGTGSVSPEMDYCAAANDPAGAGLANVCIDQGMDPAAIGVYDPADKYFVDVVSGGNPDLKPEVADTFTAGIDWQSRGPIAVHASVDYLHVTLHDAIEDFGPGFDIDECAVSADPDSAACRTIERSPDGTISTVHSIPINFANATIDAIDLSFGAQAAAPGWASVAPDSEVEFEVRASHYLRNASALSPSEPSFDCVGFFACGDYNLQGAVTPATTMTTSLIYYAGPFEAMLRWRWIDGVDNVATKAADFYGDPPPVLAIPHLDAANYIDLALQCQVTAHVRIQAGVDNLFAQPPRLMASDQVQANTDPARYDVFGRRYFLALRMQLAI